MCSCNNEDDLNEMFVGQKWYMHGATINGMTMNSDVKNFYTEGHNGYYISFASGTFQGALGANNTFGGSWVADGRNKSIRLNFTKTPSISSSFDTTLFGILKRVNSYKGDANVMELRQDNKNIINFNTRR